MADAPIGVVYITSMTRPDAALALAALYLMDIRKESHMGSVCVAGAGLDAAVFCDIVARMYMPGARNGNQALAVGLATDPGVPDSPMVKSAVARRNDKGDFQYARTIQRVTDTSQPEAVLRNGVTFNAASTVILSGPATHLAKSLDILGAKDLYRQRVRSLVVVDAGIPYRDTASLRRILAEWPSPTVFCGRDVGEAFRFPGAALDQSFAWAPAHPVVDAYKAFQTMPYDAPLYDLVAAWYAVHPESGFFRLSGTGSIAIADDGGVSFSPGGGNVKSLQFDPASKAALQTALMNASIASPRGAGGRGGRGGSGRGAADGNRGAFGMSGAPGRSGAIRPAIIPGDK